MQLQPIDYAPIRVNDKRRRAFRRMAIGLAAVLVAILAIKSAPSAWRHVKILYWQHRAMTYSAPADQIVYDDEPSDVARLRASNPSMTAGSNGELLDFAKPWDRLFRLVSPPGLPPTATCFLHERTDANGERFLVMVELRPAGGMGMRAYAYHQFWSFDYYLVKPGGLSQLPEDASPKRLVPLLGESELGAVSHVRATRWYAGQPDSHDPSHFTIRGVSDGKPVQLNGWLRDRRVGFDLH